MFGTKLLPKTVFANFKPDESAQLSLETEEEEDELVYISLFHQRQSNCEALPIVLKGGCFLSEHFVFGQNIA